MSKSWEVERPFVPLGEEDCCPDCGEPWKKAPLSACICDKPMHIYIEPGKHIHIHCPVHGDRKIYGSPVVM